jgi:thiol-disulfide isomerase/thioredoxin
MSHDALPGRLACATLAASAARLLPPRRPGLRLRRLACRVLLAAALPCAAAQAAEPAQLRVPTLMGADFDLAAHRGQVVIVHFWATWCPPCIQEMPALEAFYEQYRERGVDVLALSVDRLRDLDAVHHMMHHMNMAYAVAMAHQARVNSFGEPAALPVTYVLDRQGVVRAEMRPDTDPVTEENLRKAVAPLLSEPAPPSPPPLSR